MNENMNENINGINYTKSEYSNENLDSNENSISNIVIITTRIVVIHSLLYL